MAIQPNKTYEINRIRYSYSDKVTEPVYHYHNYYEIYILRSGDATYFVNDKSFKLKKNDIIFIGRNMIHKPNYMSKNYTRCKIYLYNDSLDENVISALEMLCGECAYTPENPEYIQNLIKNLEAEFSSSAPLSLSLIRSYLTELIAYCSRNKSLYFDNELRNPVIERIVNHINTSYHENITLTDIAENMNMSSVYLSRLFKTTTGFSFKEYLIAIRLKHAKELLLTTAKSVKEIAMECGFNDSNYFSKLFHSETGLSPLKYRKSK